MPKGSNPNSRANLIKNADKTPEERRKHASEMGKASGKARQELKAARETAKGIVTGKNVALIIKRLIAMSEHGNINATKLLLDILGEDLKSEATQKEQKANTERLRAQTEQIKAQTEQIKAQTELIKAKAAQIGGDMEEADDGFLEALGGSMSEVWDDEAGGV